MNKSRTIAAKLYANRCQERGCIVRDQPQHFTKAWPSGIFRALRLVFDTAALPSIVAALTASSLLMLCPASAHAQGGVPLWTNVFPGPPGGPPLSAIAVDSTGNVFVAGYSWNGRDEDYLVIAYSNAGMPLWTNYYAGPENGDDKVRGIAVDNNGNVFVTGYSYDSTESYADYVTLKYSGTGVPLWTNRYNGIANQHDAAWAIAVNSNGDVFVTGGSYNGSSMDFATIMYSNSGVPLWTNYYHGPAGIYDFATAIAVDSAGNVLVAGVSYNNGFPINDSDYVTIKYSSAGDLLWINRYDGPDDALGNSQDQALAVAVDTSGNVFVTGDSFNGTNLDYATVAYSHTGIPLWTNRYNGPGNAYDSARAIASDSSGNVFVTGYSSDFGTIAYSSTGLPLWTRRYNAPANALALDSSGNVFVTGRSWNGSNYDYATAAYSNTGEALWAKRYNGLGNSDDSPSSIAVDRSGNVFVTGSSVNDTNYDYATIKYSSSVPPPRLDFQKLNNELVLSWTNAGFTLQTAPAVTGPFTNLPAATSPYTNPLTGPQQFFRLISN